MKATPKTDEIIVILREAVNDVILMEYSLKKIEKANDKGIEADKTIAVYKSNWDYFLNCKITSKDLYDEYWEICPNIDELPKYAKAMWKRFENAGVPVWIVSPKGDYLKQINSKICNMELQGSITKSQASDLMGLFDLLMDWVILWLFRVQAIMEKMGVAPNTLIADKQEKTGVKADRTPILPEELNTDEAKKWLQVAIDGGLLNSDYSPTGKTNTKPQKALLAEILSDKIGLKHKYKPFETLWNVKGLAKQRYKTREETGTVKGGNIIEEVFKGK